MAVQASQQETQAGQSALSLQERFNTASPVFYSFAEALANIGSKYPEMTGYDKKKAMGQSEDAIWCEHSHNFIRPSSKRAVVPSDFRENGFTVRLLCKAMPLPGQSYAMPPPALNLDHLQFYVWTEVQTAANPSPGLVAEINMIIRTHLQKLKEIDKTAPDNKVSLSTDITLTDIPIDRIQKSLPDNWYLESVTSAMTVSGWDRLNGSRGIQIIIYRIPYDWTLHHTKSGALAVTIPQLQLYIFPGDFVGKHVNTSAVFSQGSITDPESALGAMHAMQVMEQFIPVKDWYVFHNNPTFKDWKTPIPDLVKQIEHR